MKKVIVLFFVLIFAAVLTMSCSSNDVSFVKCGDKEFGEWTYYHTIDLNSGIVTLYYVEDNTSTITKTMTESELNECKMHLQKANFNSWGKVSYWESDYAEVPKIVDGYWIIEVTLSDGKELSFGGSGITPEKAGEFEKALRIAGIKDWRWI